MYSQACRRGCIVDLDVDFGVESILTKLLLNSRGDERLQNFLYYFIKASDKSALDARFLAIAVLDKPAKLLSRKITKIFMQNFESNATATATATLGNCTGIHVLLQLQLQLQWELYTTCNNFQAPNIRSVQTDLLQ